jgi:hypothetical protein
MQVFSATQAISPAVERTKSLLFRPFEWGSFLKLCFIAILTEGSSGGFNAGSPGGGHGAPHLHNASFPSQFNPAQFNPAWIPAFIAIGLAVFVLAFALFYLIVRLRFALFYCLIHQSRQIRPGWRLYREQAFRYFLLSIGIGLGFIAIVAAIAVPFVFGFVRLFHDHQADQVSVGAVLSLILLLIPVILLVILAAIAINVILRDFMLPHIALDNATAGEAWAAVRVHIAQEKGPFLLYTVLRVLLPIAVFFAMVIALIIPVLVLAGIGGLAVTGLHAVLGHIAAIVATIICIAIVVAFVLFACICLGGPLCIGIRNYALVFYGGRYPVLGNILWPPAPVAEPGAL